ncbi:MAG: GspMb/PilO family protein [Dehalococcoidia bacterium]
MSLRGKFTVVELLLIVLVVAAAFVMVRAFRDARESVDALRDARTRVAAAQVRASEFNLEALEAELERLRSAPSAVTAFPTRAQAERRVGDIGLLVIASDAVVGPLVQGELSTTVSNDEIGIESEEPPPRSYEAIELRLQLDGDAFALVDLIERLARQLPNIVIGDIRMVPQDDELGFRMDVSILLYHA